MVVFFFLFIDQITKHFIIQFLKAQPGYVFNVLPFFDLVYVWNYGISFGMLRSYYQYSNYFFMSTTTIIIFYILHVLRSTKIKLEMFCYHLVLAGALGNLIDRIFRGAVFDFIYLYYLDYSFPAFNIADSCIFCGCIILVFFHSKFSKT